MSATLAAICTARRVHVPVTIVISLTTLLISGNRAFAQRAPTPAPARDAAANVAAAAGTAEISGIVVSDDAGRQPIRRARVVLSTSSVRPGELTTTDDAGRFTVQGLAAGAYTLRVVKTGYVTTYYGSRRAGRGPGTPIALTDGQHVDGLAVPLSRAAAISGAVRLESGRPVAGVEVTATRVEVVDGRRRTDVADLLPSFTTDDRGMYRLFGLRPGQYVVRARASTPGQNSVVLHPVLPAEVRWADAVAASRATAPGTAASVAAPQMGRAVAYVPVYFPDTTRVEDADLITVGAGEERAGIDLRVAVAPTARVSGVLVDPSGQPPRLARITLSRADDELTSEGTLPDLVTSLLGQGAEVAPNGQFAIRSVLPGRYNLDVRATPAGAAPGGGDGVSSGPMAAAASTLALMIGGSESTVWAHEEIFVNGQDVTALTLQLRPGLSVTGRIVYERGTTSASSSRAGTPADPPKHTITMAPVRSATQGRSVASMVASGLSSVSPAADGTFEIKGVTPSRYDITVSGAGFASAALGTPPVWTIKSVSVNGQDVTDLPLDVSADSDVKNVQITVSDRITGLSGTVLDASDRPTGAYAILVFSTARGHWRVGSRRVFQRQPGTDGRFSAFLPPGEYYLAAVTEVDTRDLFDPAFLELVSASAIQVLVPEGATTRQDVRVGK